MHEPAYIQFPLGASLRRNDREPSIKSQGVEITLQVGAAHHIENHIDSPMISQPLYLRGSRMEAYYPASIPIHGMALNITVLSYALTRLP